MSTLKEIIKRKANRKARLQASLKSLKNQLIKFGAIKIILFGSFLKEEIDVNSDLDLLVIMPSSKTGKMWTNLIYENLEIEISTDFIVYNREEFKEMLLNSSFIQNIVNIGRVIYEKIE